MPSSAPLDPDEIAWQIDVAVRRLPTWTAAGIRQIRREHSRRLRAESPECVLAVARRLRQSLGHRWVGLELIRYHEPTLQQITRADVEELGAGMDSWGWVDAFAGFVAGPAWLRGRLDDATIHHWTRSADRWWRRAALVSTVVLNSPSHGGKGDVPRTLAVCRLLVHDRDDMVAKAMSWALRKCVAHDPREVRRFLCDHEAVLAARVKREVQNKLATGLKNPRRATLHK